MGINRNLSKVPEVLTVSGSSIGIGTTSPRGKLHLSSDSDMYFKISRVSGNYASQFYRNAVDGTLSWQSILSDNSTAHSYITCGEGDASHAAAKITMQEQGGNVGIGTASPGNKLDVRNTVSTQIRMGTDQGARPYWNIGRDNVDTGNFVIADQTSIRMSITNSGNVGIGTTSPSYLLQADTSNEYQISWNRSGISNRWALGADTGGTYFSNRTNSVLPLYMTNSGDVAIGATSTSSYKLYVNGGQYGTYLKGGDLGVGSDILRAVRNDNVTAMLVRGDGNVGIGTTSPSSALHVVGTVTATALALAGNYNASVPTDSSWSSYQTLIPTTTLTNNVTYLISVKWTYSYPSNNQPYYYNCAFLWVGASTNSTGTDNEFTPIGSTHTGGTGASISFRTIAAFSGTSGIQARLNSFPTLGGSIQVKATRLE